MISFIVIEDNKNIQEIYRNIINKILMPYELDYKIYQYTKYNNELKRIIKEAKELKIYIIDLELPVKSGIEIAQEIRRNDWESPIIILTAHDELELRVFKKKLLILDFISKFDNYEKELKEAISLIIMKRKVKKAIYIKQRKEIHNISFNNILYILRDNETQTTHIVTNEKEYETRQSLLKIEKQLDERFCKTHRSCIINKEKIKTINLKEKTICFENNIKINYISRNYKSNLKI